MEPFEIELKNALNRAKAMPAAELAALNERIVQTFARKQKGFSRLLCVYLAVMTVGILVLLALFMTTSDLKQCLLYGMLILILYEGTVLMKLWFWIMHGKVTTMREIKLLQLAVAELKARSLPAPPSSAPLSEASDAPALEPVALAPRKVWPIILLPVWLVAVAGFIGLIWPQLPHEPRDVTPYFEKIVSAGNGATGEEWQQGFEVTRARQCFYPHVVTSGKTARVWISVAPEGRRPLFTGQVEPGWRMFFWQAAPGRYVVKGRTERADGDFTLRIGGVDEVPAGNLSFSRLFLLMLCAAMAVAIPMLWLQGRWLRRIDPELQR